MKKGSAWFTLPLFFTIGAAYAAPGNVTYYYTDPQGTVLAEADAQGNVTATYDYRPYGAQAMGSPKDGPGYTGHVNDADSGFVYMQARYYDVETGRFLSVDPVSPSPANTFNFNRYSYGNLAPVTHIDPDGRVVVYTSDDAQELATTTREASPIVEQQLKTLEQSKNVWKITFAHLSGGKNGLQSHVSATNFDDAKSQSEGGTGKGTGGEVFINKWSEKVKVADKAGGETSVVKVTKGEALAHELTHAVQNDSGTTSKDSFTREHSAREVEDEYRKEQRLKGARNNVDGN